MMNSRKILETVKRHLGTSFGDRLRGVVLYGSCARGDQTPESDIDIIVLLDTVPDVGIELRRCVRAVYPLALEWDRRISVKPVEASAYRDSDCPLFRRVRKEGIAA